MMTESVSGGSTGKSVIINCDVYFSNGGQESWNVWYPWPDVTFRLDRSEMSGFKHKHLDILAV